MLDVKVKLNCGDAPVGSPKPVIGYSFTANGIPGIPAGANDYEYVDVTDIPVDLDVFAANFHRFQVLGTTVELQPGESLGDRVIDPIDIDDSVPQALGRANKVSIFENL